MRRESSQLLDPAYLSTLASYPLMARVAVEGFISGLHRSLFHGFGSEFMQYRSYTPGEDPRLIDWKAFGRTERLLTKVYQEETNMSVYLVLDASGSLAYQGKRAPCSKFRYACMLTAALAYLASRQGDKVGLTVYQDSVVESIPPGQRANRLAAIYHALAQTRPAGSANHHALFDFLGHQLRGRGLIIFISDMLEAEATLPSLMTRMRIRHFDGIALQVLDPDEVDFPTEEAARFVDMETEAELITSPKKVAERYNAAMRQAHETLRRGFTESRLQFRSFSTYDPFDKAMAAFLHQRKQMGR